MTSPQPPTGTHLAVAGNLKAGDVITELGTPDGPWLTVVRLDRARRCAVVRADDLDEDVDAPIGQWIDQVLRKDRA